MRSTPIEDIVENLLDQGVSEAHKIVISREGKKITTDTIILTFHGSVIPPQIIVGYLSNVDVFPYVPNHFRCFFSANNTDTTRTTAITNLNALNVLWMIMVTLTVHTLYGDHPALTAVRSKAPPLTARCLSPLPGFESRPGHMRKLPVTWG